MSTIALTIGVIFMVIIIMGTFCGNKNRESNFCTLNKADNCNVSGA